MEIGYQVSLLLIMCVVAMLIQEGQQTAGDCGYPCWKEMTTRGLRKCPCVDIAMNGHL
jgi:hypothetical protein